VLALDLRVSLGELDFRGSGFEGLKVEGFKVCRVLV
jgi:hypothetical protein